MIVFMFVIMIVVMFVKVLKRPTAPETYGSKETYGAKEDYGAAMETAGVDIRLRFKLGSAGRRHYPEVSQFSYFN